MESRLGTSQVRLAQFFHNNSNKYTFKSEGQIKNEQRRKEALRDYLDINREKTFNHVLGCIRDTGPVVKMVGVLCRNNFVKQLVFIALQRDKRGITAQTNVKNHPQGPQVDL